MGRQYLESGATVTLQLRSKELEMETLHGVRVDNVIVGQTWMQLLKKTFESAKVQIPDLSNVFVVRAQGNDLTKHPLDEQIRELLDKEFKYILATYTVAFLHAFEEPAREPSMRKRKPQFSGCTSCPIKRGRPKKGTHAHPTKQEDYKNAGVGESGKLTSLQLDKLHELSLGFGEDTFDNVPRVSAKFMDFDQESQASQDSLMDVLEAGIENDVEIKESILGNLKQRASNNQLLLVREEIRCLRREGKWQRFAGKAPKLGNLLIDIFFPN